MTMRSRDLSLRQVIATVGVIAVAVLWAASPARAALSHDGSVTVEYSGTFAQSFVYQRANPAVWQGSMQFKWDEKATFALSGRAQGTPTATLVSASLTIGGGESNTYAPPNAGHTCSAKFSLRPGAPMTIFLDYSVGLVSVHALLPTSGHYVQGSAGPKSNCYVPPSGGFGFAVPHSASKGFAAAADPLAAVTVPSNPYSRPFSANGSDTQVTQTFSAVLEVVTNGKTGGPHHLKLTPAEVQAKLNALDALKQTLPAAAYPCIAAAAGTVLLTGGLSGVAVGVPLIVLGAPLCSAYYSTILAELATVKDPPRDDYWILAPATATAAAGATIAAAAGGCARWHKVAHTLCIKSTADSARLLAAAHATASVARAIAITIAREVGAQRAGNHAAAAAQDRHLRALERQFLARRRTEVAAGRALAALFHTAKATLVLDPSHAAQARRGLLAGLAKRGATRGQLALARRLLRAGRLDVLPTLGR